MGGFSFDSQGGVWVGFDKIGVIMYYLLIGFDVDGKLLWGLGVVICILVSIQLFMCIVYFVDSDMMVFVQGVFGSNDWMLIGMCIEVYYGWCVGNMMKLDLVIMLLYSGVKLIDVVGNYLFVGYWFSSSGLLWLNVDVFNFVIGKFDMMFVNMSFVMVDISSVIDVMYSICVYCWLNGEYVVMKNNVKGNSIIVYWWMF